MHQDPGQCPAIQRRPVLRATTGCHDVPLNTRSFPARELPTCQNTFVDFAPPMSTTSDRRSVGRAIWKMSGVASPDTLREITTRREDDVDL